MLSTDADGSLSLNRNGSVFFHSQLPESDLSRIFSSRITRHIRICRPGLVKGDQQRDPSRNGIIAVDGAAAYQGDFIFSMLAGIRDRFTQIRKGLAAGLKNSCILCGKMRRDRIVCIEIH